MVVVVACLACLVCTSATASAQKRRAAASGGEEEFGPVVRAYLGYLRAQQEVVDDRVSRREINQAYYRRNSNRIHALKQMALRIARESDNDYLPELEAVALDEFDILFFDPMPTPESLRVGETLNYTFRFLGTALAGREKFYLFARLDPYEQAELRKKGEASGTTAPHVPATETQSSTRTLPANAPANAPVTAKDAPSAPEPTSRPRRVNSP